jgi:hypothetical protein
MMLAGMRHLSRRFTLLIALYVGLDLANPLMPGALRFNPDESVDAMQWVRDLRAPIAAVRPRIDASRVAADLTSAPRPPRAVPGPAREWLVQEREGHVVAPDPPASEDH